MIQERRHTLQLFRDPFLPLLVRARDVRQSAMRSHVFLQFFELSLGPSQPAHALARFASLAHGPSCLTGVHAEPPVRQRGRHGDLPRKVPSEVLSHFGPDARADTDAMRAFRERVRRGVEVVREDLEFDKEAHRGVGLWKRWARAESRIVR